MLLNNREFVLDVGERTVAYTAWRPPDPVSVRDIKRPDFIPKKGSVDAWQPLR